MTDMVVKSYEDAVAWVASGRNGLWRNAGTRTRVIKNDDGTYSVRYRLTDVVVYHPNGDITLDSGGWLTQTTAARWEEFTTFRQVSHVRWGIVANPRYDGGNWTLSNVAYFDGITFTQDPEDGHWSPVNPLPSTVVDNEDAENRSMRRLVNLGLRKWSRDNGGKRCGRCLATLENGADPEPETRREHIIDHLMILGQTGDLSRDLTNLIVTERGYSVDHIAPRREWVRDYLLRFTLFGATGQRHGRAPADAPVGSSHRGWDRDASTAYAAHV